MIGFSSMTGFRTLVLTCFLLRLFTLGLPDLSDPSEGRFANAAHYMVEKGDWITPYIYTTENLWTPYLAKPPFAIWLTAVSFSIFDEGTWSARLPSFFGSCLTVLFCFLLLQRMKDGKRAQMGVLILLGTPVFIFLGSSSITDPLLMSAVTAALYTFWVGLTESKKLFRWLFFVPIGIGFLIKGPVMIVLCLLPVFLWCFLAEQWNALKWFPWIGGISLAILIASPWYILAEINNPGFLNYFFVQENIGRYFLSDFGIKFGSTHRKLYGTSWLYLSLIGLPWSFLIAYSCQKNIREKIISQIKADSFSIFLIAWLLSPAIFFTFAKQILPTYVLSSLVPLAIILACHIPEEYYRRVQCAAALFIGLSFFVLGVLHSEISSFTSTRRIVNILQKDHLHERIGSFLKVPQSAVFYAWHTGIKFFAVQNEEQLRQSDLHYVIIEKNEYEEKLSDETRRMFTILQEASPWLILKRDPSF